jgi:hypothetical protein
MAGWLSFLGGTEKAETLPDIFPIPIAQNDFIEIDVQNIFQRILLDTLERTDGIKDEQKPLLWDNCVASEKQDGLVTLLAKAISSKKELFVVYRPSIKVIGKATPEEEAKIREGYKTKAEPVSLDAGGIGMYITFKNYLKSDLVRFYSALEYCAVGGLWKQANISKSVQIKINELRSSVSLGDSAAAKAQAKAMADGMAQGKDILADAKDVIESLAPDLTATNSTMDLIAKKQSYLLGLPASYFSGEQSATGLSDTGKSDAKAVDRGLKGYFFSIIKPVCDGLFEIKSEYAPEDTAELDSALKLLETFDRTSNEIIGLENKTKIANLAFGLDEDEVGDEPEPEPIPVIPGQVPPKPGAPPAVPPKQPPG